MSEERKDSCSFYEYYVEDFGLKGQVIKKKFVELQCGKGKILQKYRSTLHSDCLGSLSSLFHCKEIKTKKL